MAKMRDYNFSATNLFFKCLDFFENKVTFQMVAKLDSETGWTGKLRSKTNLHKCQNYENDFCLQFLLTPTKKIADPFHFFLFSLILSFIFFSS